MNRREFIFSSAAGVLGVTMLSPLQAISQAMSSNASISEHMATVTPKWLKRFDGAFSSALLSRRRLRLLMDGAFAGMSAPFWSNRPIHSTARAYMSKPGYVTVLHHRYIVVTGTMATCAANRAMLWIDSHFDSSASDVPHAVLSVIDVGSSSRHMWLINNHMAANGTIDDVPHNLRLCMSRCMLSRRPLRSEGGLLQEITRLGRHNVIGVTKPRAYGIPLYRCDTSVSG